jgi:hypothetical protein
MRPHSEALTEWAKQSWVAIHQRSGVEAQQRCQALLDNTSCVHTSGQHVAPPLAVTRAPSCRGEICQ